MNQRPGHPEDGLGVCPVCGRPRTLSPGGAPVSCHSRAVIEPKTPREASSILDALTALTDRVLLRTASLTLGTPSGCCLGTLGLVALALVAGAAFVHVCR